MNRFRKERNLMSLARTTRSVIFLFLTLFALLFVTLIHLKVEPHLPLLGAVILVCLYGLLTGADWRTLEKGMTSGIVKGLAPILILMMVGLVIASWMYSGTVPTMLVYGLYWIQPEWFGLSALFLTILVSTFCGSSFTTVGTVGVALMGMAQAMGISPALAAGAVVCGACFGDKMSPLSDSTNLASGVTGVPLFTHIRHMMGTTVPAILITVLLFFVLGHQGEGVEPTKLKAITHSLEHSFLIHPAALLPPLAVLGLAWRRLPALPVLLIGCLVSWLLAWWTVPDFSPARLIDVLQNGLQMKTGNPTVDQIVNKGGLQSMMWTVSLILIALSLGGLIQALGLFELFLSKVKRTLTKAGSLIAATAASAVGVNLLAGEMYLSILLPGQAFQSAFSERGIPARFLSRTLEDAGTLVNALVPWGVSGAFFASTLGVPVLEYLPYAFFPILSLVMTLILGYIRARAHSSPAPQR
ncbi:Na+/H+ antiporter NhaC [Salinithrix halophila]|uniref:Na+/H+ antiporter NhaC n=1 Tax=Salinithrix halophila TaxID=1485204 RepID=A0ABV8JAL5_9BACL